MRNVYKFCSICGARLKQLGKNLACTRCQFVNYRNPRPTVTGLILFKNKLLLVKRKNEPFQGWWDVMGGFLEHDEGADEAMEREIKEEIDLPVKKKQIFGTYTGTYPSSVDPCSIITIVYLIEPRSGDARVRDFEEICAIKWFSKKELPKKIAFDSNRRIIKDFLKAWPSRPYRG